MDEDLRKDCISHPRRTLTVIREELVSGPSSSERRSELFEAFSLCCEEMTGQVQAEDEETLEFCSQKALETMMKHGLLGSTEAAESALKSLFSAGRLLAPSWIFELLFSTWTVGRLPDIFAARVLGELIAAHPQKFAPFLPSVLGRTCSILGLVHGHGDVEGQVCLLLSHCASAIRELHPVPERIPKEFETDVLVAFQTTKRWLFELKRHDKLVPVVVRACSLYFSLLRPEMRERSEFQELLPRVFAALQKEEDTARRVYALVGLESIFSVPCPFDHDDKLVADVLDFLLTEMRRISDQKVELACEQSFISTFKQEPDCFLAWLMRQEPTERLLLDTVRRVVNSCEMITQRKAMILMWLRPLTIAELDKDVQSALLNLISALDQHAFLSIEGSEKILSWLQNLAGHKSDEAHVLLQRIQAK